MSVSKKITELATTQKEIKLANTLAKKLKWWIGSEDYSDTTVSSLSKALGWDVKTTKGVVGSLVKKELLEMWDLEDGSFAILFCDQEELDYDF